MQRRKFIKRWLQISKKKLIKIYPLHLITFLAIFIPWFGYALDNIDQTKWFLNMMWKAVLNLLLLQSLALNESTVFSVNGVSWFLSMYMILMLLSPIIIFFTSKVSTLRKKLILFLVIFIAEVIFGGECQYSNYWRALTYTHPFIRLFDFTQGILLGQIFVEYKENVHMEITKGTIIESIVLLIYILAIIFIKRLPYSLQYNAALVIESSLLLFVIALGGGMLSKLFSCKILVFVGDISMEIFLIHMVVIRKITNLEIDGNILNMVLIITLTLIFSIAANKWFEPFVVKLLNKKES